jgi:thymidylate kinase
MLITFSGLDGAGKSTLTRLLKERLEREGAAVTVSHMYRDVGLYAFAWAALERLMRLRGGAPGAGGGANGAGRASGAGRGAFGGFARALVWNRSLRVMAYPLDLVVFLAYRLYVERVRGRVLIMDRYFYDTLVDVSAGRRVSRVARLLARLTPTPSVPVLLDISAGQAFARKGEHTLAYLERRREAYMAVFPNHGRGLVLAAGGDIAGCLRAVEAAIRERGAGL